MGQQIAKSLSSRINVPKSLGRAIDLHEKNLAEDAMRDISKRQSLAKGSYIDPSATTAGFTRGTSSAQTSRSRQDEEQERFLKQQNQNSPNEMPEDLIKFLNISGPLERQVDKEMTSPKVLEALESEKRNERDQMDDSNSQLKQLQQQEANLRTRRKMSLVQNDEDEDMDRNDISAYDATTTIRTTNFSSKGIVQNDNELLYTDIELFRLLQRYRENITSNENGDKSKEESILQNFSIQELERIDCIDGDGHPSQRNNKEYLDIIQNALMYCEVPTLMQDTDKSIVGTYKRKVKDLSYLKLKEETEVKLWIQVEEEEMKKQSNLIEEKA